MDAEPVDVDLAAEVLNPRAPLVQYLGQPFGISYAVSAHDRMEDRFQRDAAVHLDEPPIPEVQNRCRRWGCDVLELQNIAMNPDA
jgi:hypothetical protein